MTPTFVVGLSARKRALLQAFCPERRLHFMADWRQVPAGVDVLVWGATSVPDAVQARGVSRVEDGFLRSVGLGAAFARPSSWVVDDVGIHYDCSRPSALELLLQHSEPDADTLQRAAALRQRIVRAGLTKYNLRAPRWQRPATERSVCLAVGQVEGDASLQLGSPALKSNVQFLRAVRAMRPQAYLVYKPHPDVCAGVRQAGRDEMQAAALCDEVLQHADMAQLLGLVDECHVMTSLAGFEALLRGCKVVTHGLPFYAGWGLTTDLLPPLARRTRRLTLDALVAGALLQYPRYIGSHGRRVEVEAVVDELEAARLSGRRWHDRLASASGLLAGRVARAWQAARQPMR